MSLLAVNYSPQAAELLERGAVDFDLFKVPDWDEVIEAAAALKPCRVHFPFQVGALRERPELERSARLMAATDTPTFNVHLAPSSERFTNIAVGDASTEAVEQVVEELLADLGPARERFGPQRVLVENLIYRGEQRGLLKAAVEPALLHALVDRGGCGFLLDVSHARISAVGLERDPWEYLDALPVHAISELHVTGVQLLDGQLRDHLPFGEEDWSFLDGIIGRVKAGAWPAPEVVAFEYGGVGPVFNWRSDIDVLAEQLPRLRDTVAELV